ncbi:glycosyltransferase family 2 protein [Acidithiobacillus sp. 'AMD consortium']|uniref:Glycosyltransferase n=1 Tax=Acidithiobacillus ferruginosus TaxID=3063951 RepID=A0ACD5IH89_9PROT|nr:MULTISPECIES: glycosyltransferase [Acidithiobacillus]MBU2814209.1 glycosyltransferase family 2 protein [Acidithiobacillus ferruginosus]QFG77312.1 glycosyltransferase family 2 protein [Acidithiobacillus sp. 'AMD consortium']
MSVTKVALIIPTLNGGEVWLRCLDALRQQVPPPEYVLIVDSGSKDGTDVAALENGFEVLRLTKGTFDHGGTRQMAANRLTAFDVLVYLTQDAVLSDSNALAQLVAPFADLRVGATYGRQLPRLGSGAIEAHARLFNYPPQSNKRTIADKTRMGIKAAFTSNSFAAYRTEALMAVGGFPPSLILGEDMVVAARMLQAGWAVAYVAEAQVWHSHGYSVVQEFKRYFDIGVMHQDQAWILRDFGKPEGEGGRFVRSEIAYLIRHAPWLLPSAFIRTLAKYLGYKLGQHSSSLPLSTKRKLSMHRGFWDKHG